jgi:hypothetical protein
MGHLFISYSSKDRALAARIAESLRRSGYEVWFDRWKITGREPYWDEIQDGIENCTHFLFMISPDSISTNSGARRELYHAGGLKKTPTFIPIMLRRVDFEKLPILVSPGAYQIHDFATQPFDVAFEQVITAITASETVEQISDPVLSRVANVLETLEEEAHLEKERAQAGPATPMDRVSNVLEHLEKSDPHISRVRPPVKSATTKEAATREQAEPRFPNRLLLGVAAIALVLVLGSAVLLLGQANVQPTPTATATPIPPTATLTLEPSAEPTTPAPVVVAPTATETTISPTVTPEPPDVSLVFDDKQLMIINISSRTLDLSGLTFVQKGQSERTFSASNLRSASGLFPSSATPSRNCFQIARNDIPLPDPLDSCRRGQFLRLVANSWFWVPQSDSVATFEVRQGDKLLATCETKAKKCDFALP